MWENPGLRCLIYLSLRRDDLCDTDLAPDCEPGSHASECPVAKLDEALASTREVGELVQRAFELDFQCEKHIAPPWHEIPADEYTALKLIAIERSKYEREQAKERERRQPPRS